jgi:anthraniloyl-CoA monooxygenase
MFTPFRLRDLVLGNRIVVSPMCQYVADDGTPGDWHLVHLGSRALGGAGLVMVEMTDVSPEARISPWCAGLYKPEHAGAWKRIVDFVHRESDAGSACNSAMPAAKARPAGCGKETVNRCQRVDGR